jgi:dCMP deaminase
VVNYERKIELLQECYELALRSPDPSTQNGAVAAGWSGLIHGRGWNDFPPGVAPRLKSPEKYLYIQHAERNALYNAGMGANVLVCPWIACNECAKAMIHAGVERIVTHKQRMDLGYKVGSDWQSSCEAGFKMFEEAGITIEYIDHVFNIEPIRVGGVLWTP